MLNGIRKLVRFLIDTLLLNLSLIISIFLKYDQIQITNRNINFFIYYNISFCIIYFILIIVGDLVEYQNMLL